MEKCKNDELVNEYAKKLKVIGHPLRMKILILIEDKSSCVGDLWQCLNTSQPSISQHLAILKDAGIVTSKVDGNKRIYNIVDDFVKSIIQNINLTL
ncbi:ArsR family transcriptional regulator [Thiospirochaeta perfilievii]|uniref:ArsR family transcriptional regulator n=1 Tax=Thiospirochaeta perfilievii TaxID=252967 RepID=A0A5C1QAD7_9SPIO|nr:metalloregulator ArsR/SmtB family transcription factor [Thiospirochaeta perfilievii]QEN03624.1 ArsR family transcriptional regulator [Thiospirochaeta perfilievii]